MGNTDSAKKSSGQSPSYSGKRWKARLVVSLIMLILALVSLLIIEIHRAYWIFVSIMSGVDALLAIWLVWYVQRNEASPFPGNLWHMILHWIGLVATLYLIALFVERGVISQTEAALFALILLALTLYLAGIYTDTTFMLIGITLAIMAGGSILIKSYLLFVMVPVMIIVAFIILVMVTRDHQKQSNGN